jgi:hypothetical protein
MTSAFGTHTLLQDERFDGISDSHLNWLGVPDIYDTARHDCAARRRGGLIRNAICTALCDTTFSSALRWSEVEDWTVYVTRTRLMQLVFAFQAPR